MAYRIAGIDVHKKKLPVVVADVEVEDEYQFERRWYGSNPEHLQRLAEWLAEQEVEEVVMESTAQYWQGVWGALERYRRPTWQKREGAGTMSGKLHLAQAQSNRGRRGRKRDFPDAERLVKRLVAQELVLSFVPDPEQRLWRTVTRRKHQMTRLHVRMQNQLACGKKPILSCPALSQICWASVPGYAASARGRRKQSGSSGRPGGSALAGPPAQLCDALGACTELNPVSVGLSRLALEELQLLEQQIGQLDQEIANLLRAHQEAVKRLAEVPGRGSIRRSRSLPKSVPRPRPSLPPRI